MFYDEFQPDGPGAEYNPRPDLVNLEQADVGMEFTLTPEQEQTVSRAREQILAIAKKVGFAQWAELSTTHVAELRSKDAAIENCYMYHVFIGSTANPALTTRFDLDGSLSIADYIDSLAEENKVDGYDPNLPKAA
jgi:hypothetical protein